MILEGENIILSIANTFNEELFEEAILSTNENKFCRSVTRSTGVSIKSGDTV